MNVRIEKLVYGGEGLAHHEGHTVFVPFVLPDEVVTVRAIERKKKFVRGQVVEIVERSAARAAPPCPHFTACGGCHYQHIPYDAQLRYKAEILRETLRRLGGIAWDGPIQTHPSPPLGYRNRAQWKVRSMGSALNLGYFRAGSTALCGVDHCPILSPLLAETLQTLRGLASAGQLPAALREIEAFADRNDNKLLLNASLVSFDEPPARLAEALRQALPTAETILLHESRRDRYELFGPGFITYEAAGTPYRVGHLSFFQVNRYLVEEMIRTATAGDSGRLALDLFAGVGLFTLPLAEKFERVIAVETNPAAFRDLAANLSQRAAAHGVNARVEQFLTAMKETPDLVLLDPPRAGLAAEALGQLAALAPLRLTYISCDPATLARDLRGFRESGYAVTEVHFFDVFPQTYHIESLVRLARSG